MRAPSGRWLLPVTAVGMAALLVVRSANMVMAASPSPVTAAVAAVTPVAAAAGSVSAPPAALPAAPLADPPVSSVERSLLIDLRHRRGELDVREAALAVRESLAGAADKRLAARVDQLASLQTRLEALAAVQRDRDEASWVKLVRVYETMKAKDAAVIFDDLDMPTLLQVVDRMKDPKAAAVLAAMQPDRARLLTTELAQLRIQANQIAPAASAGPATIGG